MIRSARATLCCTRIMLGSGRHDAARRSRKRLRLKVISWERISQNLCPVLEGIFGCKSSTIILIVIHPPRSSFQDAQKGTESPPPVVISRRRSSCARRDPDEILRSLKAVRGELGRTIGRTMSLSREPEYHHSTRREFRRFLKEFHLQSSSLI